MNDVKKVRAADHESYGTYTAIAIIVPVIGVILGIVMMTKEQPLDKKLGEHTLALSILFGFLWWFVWSWFVASSVMPY